MKQIYNYFYSYTTIFVIIFYMIFILALTFLEVIKASLNSILRNYSYTTE
jgi:hypothetical protein